ncbi:hypothetical protein CK203_018132 [Vitis vinifera]|uniref:Uncharacterized protein n=1 Tax=Vitis vinifera TaxID=29760 RepID=A0A438JNY0_VITVI|nr:hypothetical protein CK203_018132 [Vitis vinifera]
MRPGDVEDMEWIHDCYLSELQELCVDACRVYGQSSKFGQETDGRVVDLMLGIWDAVSDDDLSSMPIARAGHGPYASLRCHRNTILLQANEVWMVFKKKNRWVWMGLTPHSDVTGIPSFSKLMRCGWFSKKKKQMGLDACELSLKCICRECGRHFKI